MLQGHLPSSSSSVCFSKGPWQIDACCFRHCVLTKHCDFLDLKYLLRSSFNLLQGCSFASNSLARCTVPWTSWALFSALQLTGRSPVGIGIIGKSHMQELLGLFIWISLLGRAQRGDLMTPPSFLAHGELAFSLGCFWRLRPPSLQLLPHWKRSRKKRSWDPSPLQ